MKSKGINITVNNSIKLDATAPVPFNYGSGSSVFTYSVLGKRYIPFLGPSDNLATQLLEGRLTSTTQNACINSIVESVIGKGMFVVDNEKPNEDLLKFFSQINNSNSTIDDIARECSDGFYTQGNHFIEVVRGTFSKTKYVKVYTHSMLFSRIGKINEQTGEPETIILSKTFTRNGYIAKHKNEKEIRLYNPNELDPEKNWTKCEDGTERTMIHFKNDVSGMDYYGLPPSIAGLRYQVLEGKSAQYNIDNFENNMVLGGMLIFKGAMTQEEAEKNAKEILISHVGEGKTGRIAVVSSEQGLDEVEFKPYETQKEGSFIELDKRIEEKIVSANGWDRRLAGLDRDGGLSNGDGNLSSIYDIKEVVLLKPYRKKLVSKVIKPLVKIWSEWVENTEVKNYDFDFEIEIPLSFYGKINPETFIQVNEARTMAKMMPDDGPNGKKYLIEIKTSKDVQNKPTE
ncbi:MAG: phage portal protein [Flavobacteriales bacterium]|nr:phage portal protein [Flavobacteriales bacterium]